MEKKIILGKDIIQIGTVGSRYDNDSILVYVEDKKNKFTGKKHYSIRLRHLFDVIRKHSLRRAEFRIEKAEVYEYLIPI